MIVYAPLPSQARAVHAECYPYPPHWGYYEVSDLAHGDPTWAPDYRQCAGPDHGDWSPEPEVRLRPKT